MGRRHLVAVVKVVVAVLGWLLVLVGASILVSAWSVAFPGGSGLG